MGGDMAVSAVKPTNIEAQCLAKGMRMTEQRRIIARVLSELGRPSGCRGTLQALC